MIAPLLTEIRRSPLLWMLIFVPAVLTVEAAAPTAHTMLFVLAVQVLFGILYNVLFFSIFAGLAGRRRAD